MANDQVPAIESPAKLLVAIFEAHDEWHGEALQEALVRELEAHGVVGATIVHGVTGYGVHRAIHRRGLIGRPLDRPAILLVLDHEPRLRAVLPTVRGMIAEGIVVLVDAEVVPFA